MIFLNKSFPPRLAVILCAVLWSTSGLFIKIVAWNPLIIAGSRSLLAGILLLLIRPFSAPRGFSFFMALRRRAVWLAGFSYSATMVFFVIANKLTASANVIVLQYGAPVWAAVFGALLLKEKPRYYHIVSLFLIFAGIYVMLRDSFAGGGFLGDALAVVSGLAFGLTSVFMRMQKDASPQDGMTLSHIITAVLCLPFAFVFPPSLSPASILSITYMGIFQVGLAAVFYSYGIKRISAVQVMLIASIEPVFNPLWVYIAIGEKPASTAFIGGAIIFSAVLFSNTASIRSRRSNVKM